MLNTIGLLSVDDAVLKKVNLTANGGFVNN